MKHKRFFCFLVALLFAICFSEAALVQAPAQASGVESCGRLLYKNGEVSRRPVFSFWPSPRLTDEAIANGTPGKVVLSAILCRTGKVTDIEVIEGLPFGVTENAVEALRQARFSPAEKDSQPVSVAMKFEFRFHYLGERGPLAQGPLAGQMIESLEVDGLRAGQWDDLSKRMKTRGGET